MSKKLRGTRKRKKKLIKQLKNKNIPVDKIFRLDNNIENGFKNAKRSQQILKNYKKCAKSSGTIQRLLCGFRICSIENIETGIFFNIFTNVEKSPRYTKNSIKNR